MDRGDWVLSRAGFRGPPLFVAQAERQLEDCRAAAEEGLPTADEQESLITTLLLLGLAREAGDRLRRWLPTLAALRRSLRQTMGAMWGTN